MKDQGIFRQIKIKVDFHSPVMRMCWHAVPDAVWREFRHAHDELATPHHGWMDKLINGPHVCFIGISEVDLLGVIL